MELDVEEFVVEVGAEVEVDVSDVEGGVVMNRLLVPVIELLEGILMTIELDSKVLVSKTVVSTSRARA